MPQAAITTDIISGFPGETEAEFAESLAFIREMDFAGGHMFSYSPRPGTGAARLGGQVNPRVRKERNHILHEALEESSGKYRNFFTGRTMQVLWESASELGMTGWQMEGLTGNYLRVRAASPAPRWNELDEVLLAGEARNGLMGIIQN
jgi:threonylcarbamoyladenosine tRNA methylthiotransferase MtaB